VGWFWFVGTLVPVIGLVQVGEQAIADRYTYIPSIGLFILLSWGLGDLVWRWPRLKPLLVSAAILALAALLPVTRNQVRYWRSSEALFRHALAVTGDNPWVHCLLADTLADAGNGEEAEVHCREALRLKPGFPEVEVLYAKVLVREKKFEEATAVLFKVLQQSPADPVTHCTLGSVFSQKGDTSRAIEHYRQALNLKPDYAEAHFNLAALLARQGDAAGAIAEYRQGLRWQPDSPDALNNLAWMRAANSNPALRDGAEAVQLAQRACELTRYERPMLVGTLAAACAEAGQFEQAVETAQKARDLALASGQKELADKNQTLLELYQSRQTYHEPAEAPTWPPRE
jgi:Flp pilus assembly protein TadD